MSDARRVAPPPPAPSAYRGRFAPSPTGALHAGSVVAALASWLDARAHRGQWLVRIEDVDGPRCVPGADATILAQLEALGLRPDEPPQWQSRRAGGFEAALDRLASGGWAYPCGCTRADIARAMAQLGRRRERHGDLVYPGTCRAGLHERPVRALRMLAASTPARPQSGLSIAWQDRRLGAQVQDVAETVGDFVLRRADGLWAYQLAVVVDDAHQGITHVVRGEDLADNTPRQIHLQRALGLATPQYLHTPLVLGADGAKLSKQNGAHPIDTSDPLAVLREAGVALGLHPHDDTVSAWLESAALQWRARWIDGIRP
ncbi:MAG: tRNA glutamyl-Q(34) synthetase GluQRS [Burkholderiaceae bacterium]